MVRPEDITGYLDNQWFQSLAGFGSWLINILASILVLGFFYVILIVMEHKIKITVYPVFGAIKDKFKKRKIDKNIPEAFRKVQENPGGNPTTLEELRELNIQVGHPKKYRGKDVRKKGTRSFSVLRFPNVFKRLRMKEIDYRYRYPDGIWMLELAKDYLIPIQRPTLQDTVNLKIPEADMDLWEESIQSDIRRRTQDEDLMKKQVYMTVAIIIGAFVLSGIIIWLSMSFAGNSINNVLEEVKPMTDALKGLVSPEGPG